MKIINFDHYNKVKEFAISTKQRDSLNAALVRLMEYEWAGGETHLSPDFAPNSFSFSIHRPDGSVYLSGGVIYHGKSGEVTNNSVQISPEGGW